MTPIAHCSFCGCPSTLLCDGRVASVAHKQYRVPAGWANSKTTSCDLPVCRNCARKVSDVHINRGKQGCRWDTIDLCPLCQQVGKEPVEVLWLRN